MTSHLFDEPYYIAINIARWAAIARVLIAVEDLQLKDAYDVGAGPGWFAEKLTQRNLDVLGLEGREELVSIARARVQGARFDVVDLDRDSSIFDLAPRDLVLCVGLLYHIENPFRIVRFLEAITGKLLVLETQVTPSAEPIFRLVEEGRNVTQGLTHHAVIPSASSLTKMLFAAGFQHLYEFSGPIDHEDFVETAVKHRRRVMVIASRGALATPDLTTLAVPLAPKISVDKSRS